MSDAYKNAIEKQFEAALCALNACVDRCPEELWDAPIGDATFNQIAFHALFCADYYLGANEDALKSQAFHRENAAFFGDYEEMQPRRPVARYEPGAIRKYVRHCRAKASDVLEWESEDILTASCGFEERDLDRFELHIYNIRHIQHHTGQLAMRLRMDAAIGVPWVGSGWQDL